MRLLARTLTIDGLPVDRARGTESIWAPEAAISSPYAPQPTVATASGSGRRPARNLRLQGCCYGTPRPARVLRERRPDELLIAIPSAAGDVRERIVAVARAANVPVKTLPALNELITGDFNLTGQIRPVEVEDLLGREPVDVDLPSIAGYLAGEVVLVTGAGGSIGAELCRQIARMAPTRLVLVDTASPSCSRSSSSSSTSATSTRRGGAAAP